MKAAEKRYLSPEDVSNEYPFSIKTLEKHRSLGTAPAYSKCGRKIVYARADVDAWIDRNKVVTM